MTAPRVTVGLPVFNGERYLRETIDSILAQDHADFELLVADNASTDGTLDLLEEYRRQDPRVRILPSDRNRGAAWNYNRLVDEARGELFKWAGYDDLLAQEFLITCIAALDARPDAVLAYPDTVIIDESGAWVMRYEERLAVDHLSPARRVAEVARRVGLCNACFGVIRCEALRRTGVIRPYISSDVTLLAELAALGSFARIEQDLFFRRVHRGSSRQGDVSMDQVAAWFDTSVTSAPRWPRVMLAQRTVRALLGSDTTRSSAVVSATAFGVVYAARRARITASGLRRRGDVPPPELIHTVRAGGR